MYFPVKSAASNPLFSSTDGKITILGREQALNSLKLAPEKQDTAYHTAMHYISCTNKLGGASRRGTRIRAMSECLKPYNSTRQLIFDNFIPRVRRDCLVLTALVFEQRN